MAKCCSMTALSSRRALCSVPLARSRQPLQALKRYTWPGSQVGSATNCLQYPQYGKTDVNCLRQMCRLTGGCFGILSYLIPDAKLCNLFLEAFMTVLARSYLGAIEPVMPADDKADRKGNKHRSTMLRVLHALCRHLTRHGYELRHCGLLPAGRRMLLSRGG